ncbi:hypothetical protein [Rhodopirellula bahusiensis]|uniref:hypothetical protein n=1 Tax=Rhodopirellula bahusiensis TaxID=2014065 RepID=UPI003298E00D
MKMHLYKYGTSEQQALCKHVFCGQKPTIPTVLRGPVILEACLDGESVPSETGIGTNDRLGLSPPTPSYARVTLDFNRDRVLFSVIASDDTDSIYGADLIRQSSEWFLARCSEDYPVSGCSEVFVERLDDIDVCHWLEEHGFLYASEWRVVLANEPALQPVSTIASRLGYLSELETHPKHGTSLRDKQIDALKGVVGSREAYEAFVAIVKHTPEAIGWDQRVLAPLVRRDRSTVSRYQKKYIKSLEFANEARRREEIRGQSSVSPGEPDDE